MAAAGYTAGRDGDITFALDCAASEFYTKEQGYEIEEGRFITGAELVDYYVALVEAHPALASIEDGLDEKDYAAWALMVEKLGDKLMVRAPSLSCLRMCCR